MHGVKRERIIRILLNQPDGSLTKYRISKLADCSTSWVIEYLQVLKNKGYIKDTEVKEYEKLLDYWAGITKKIRYFEFFLRSPVEFLRNIGLDYALTTYQAENLINHYLFPTRTDVYIQKDDLPLWKERITQKGLLGKGNLRLLLHDPHVFYKREKIDGLWVVSTPQLLVDLKREGGVCLEAYEMMVEKHVRRKRD